MSSATVHRILKAAEINLHSSVYWLNSTDKVENIEAFTEDVSAVCDLYEMAPELEAEGHHVVSMDEMTGLQVLERRYPDKPMLPGSPVKIKFEYTGHGTLGPIRAPMLRWEPRTNHSAIRPVPLSILLQLSTK